MKTIIKSTIAACGFFTAVSAPLTAGADNFIFSAKGAFGDIWGSNGDQFLVVSAWEYTTQSKSTKTGSPGASVEGSYYTETECWYGYGSSDSIQFNAKGSLPKQVSASGTVPITWYEYCTGLYPVVTDTVTFNMVLTALKGQALSNWGTDHYEYGNVTVNSHFDSSNSPASVNTSSISSQNFGAMTLNGGSVGRSKSHFVQITR